MGFLPCEPTWTTCDAGFPRLVTYVSVLPGSLGSLQTTPQPTPERLSHGWFTVAVSPAVVALSTPNAHSHVPVAVTVTVPSAFWTTEPVVSGDAVGLAALAKAALGAENCGAEHGDESRAEHGDDTRFGGTPARAKFITGPRARCRLGGDSRGRSSSPPEVTIGPTTPGVIITFDDRTGCFPRNFPAGLPDYQGPLKPRFPLCHRPVRGGVVRPSWGGPQSVVAPWRWPRKPHPVQSRNRGRRGAPGSAAGDGHEVEQHRQGRPQTHLRARDVVPGRQRKLEEGVDGQARDVPRCRARGDASNSTSKAHDDRNGSASAATNVSFTRKTLAPHWVSYTVIPRAMDAMVA